ncbi:unnamed protein product, partial [Phaeothamnion confervicola]
GSHHACDKCGCPMHAFCGFDVLDADGDVMEGFGAPRRCGVCNATASTRAPTVEDMIGDSDDEEEVSTILHGGSAFFSTAIPLYSLAKGSKKRNAFTTLMGSPAGKKKATAQERQACKEEAGAHDAVIRSDKARERKQRAPLKRAKTAAMAGEKDGGESDAAADDGPGEEGAASADASSAASSRAKPPAGVRGAGRSAKPKILLSQGSIRALLKDKRLQDEGLHPDVANKGRVHCTFCKGSVQGTKQEVKQHIKTDKHKMQKGNHTLKEAANETLNKHMLELKEQLVSGSSLTPDTIKLRMRVVQVFAESGTPLHRVPYFRPLLEELSGLRLTDVSELRRMVPNLLKIEENRLSEELAGKKVAIVFDGTTRTHEVFAVVARFMDGDGRVQQRLIEQAFYKAAFNAGDLARVIAFKLMKWDVEYDDVIAFISDRCATNLAAIGALKPFYRSAMMIGCESHTFDNCGKKIVDAKVVDQYLAVVGLVGHSHKMREYFKVEVGSAPPMYCQTRRWSRRELLQWIMDNWDRLGTALVKAFSENLSQGAFITRLAEFHSKPEPRSEINRAYCRVQGMGVLVFTKPLVEATYQLESDGPLSLFAFEIIDRVAVDIKERFPTLAYPELQKTVADLCAGDPEYSKALLDNIKSVLMPAKDYFHAKIIVELKPQLDLFEAAALTNPQYMQRTDPFVADVEATLWRLVQHASAIVDADGV